MMHLCNSCLTEKPNTVTAVVNGMYYPRVCHKCLGKDETSSNAAGYDRRRGYEDNAQDTVQPYDAAGNARLEFLRLYPVQARRVFSREVVEELKKKL